MDRDLAPLAAQLARMNDRDATVPAAVAAAADQVAAVVEAAVGAVRAGGRVVYLGAGSAGTRRSPTSTPSLSARATCSSRSRRAAEADLAAVVPTGDEVVGGSSRLAAGTAQKLVLNQLSTLTMVAVGRVYGDLMVGVRPENAELRVRCLDAVARAAGRPLHDASAALSASGVDAAALGAWRPLRLTGRDAAYLRLGPALTATLVVDGAVRRGAGAAAPVTIGHLALDPDGAPCRCGQRGCLETLVRDPDRRAAGVALAVRLLALTTGVDVVVLGGAGAGEPLRTSVGAVLAGKAAGSAFLAGLDLPGRLLVAPADVPYASAGAAFLHLAEVAP